MGELPQKNYYVAMWFTAMLPIPPTVTLRRVKTCELTH
jgi:hypothetical protein